MSNKPGIYHHIGKKARDLLYRDYAQQPPIHYHYQYFDWSFYLSCQIRELVPGLGTVFRFSIPYQRANGVEVQYLHDFAGVTAGISFTTHPLLNFSGVVGTNLFSVGTALSFDTQSGIFDKYSAGFSFNTEILIASLTLNNKGDNLKASCYSSVSPSTNTAVGAELTYRFLSNETTLTMGAQHSIFPTTLLKARVNSRGTVAAIVQQQLFPTIFSTLAAELNVKAFTHSPKVGLSLSLRP